MPLKPFEIDLEAYRKIGREGVEKYRQQAEEEEALARALEESERRKAELEARPWWQKAIDRVIPGEQFRTPAVPATPSLPEAPSLPPVSPPALTEEPEKSWYTRLDERLGGILPFGQPLHEAVKKYVAKPLKGFNIATEGLIKGTTFGLGGAGGPIERGISRLFGVQPPPPPIPETTGEKIAANIAETVGSLVSGGMALKAAAPLISRVARPAIGAAQKAAEAVRALPKPTQTAAKIAGGIGAGITAEEVIRGAVTPKAKEQTLPAKLGASLRAGFGDVLSLTGSVAKMLKRESAGEKLQRAGEAVRTGFEAEPVEFNWKSFFDPDWYAVNVARAVPLTLSLIPAMYLGYRTGGAAGARIGLGPFGRAILGSVVGAAASRPLESAFEAADAYEDYLAKNPGDIAGAERAASNVFKKNLALVGLDAAQLAAAFAPVQLKPLSRLSNAIFGAAGPRVSTVIRGAARAMSAAAPEALEEGLQEAFQRQAAGEPVTFDTKMKEAMAIGGLFGAGMGGVGNVVEHIRNRTLNKLPPVLKAEVTAKAEEKAKTLPPERAWEHAFDEVMEADERKKAAVEKAVGEAVSELDAVLQRATVAHSRPELEEYAKKLQAAKAEEKRRKLFTLGNLDKDTVATLKGVAETMSPDRAKAYIRDFFVERYDVTPTRALELAESFLAREAEIAPSTTEKKKHDIAFTSGGDAVGNEYHGYIAAIDKQTGRTIGYIDYAYSNGETAIKMIEVVPEFRRQGLATQLLNKLREDVGGKITIFGDYVTPEGEAWLRKVGLLPVEQESIAPPETGTKALAEAEKPVSPKAGGVYRVRMIQEFGDAKPGEEFVGKVNKIARYRSGLVVAQLQTPEGKIFNIPVSKYAEWYDLTGKITEAAMAEAAKAGEKVVPPATGAAKITPQTTRIIQRGKKGAVRVVFPDEGHALLFDLESTIRKAAEGKVPTETLTHMLTRVRHLLGLVPGENIGRIANEYRSEVLRRAQEAKEGDVISVPKFHEIKEFDIDAELRRAYKEIEDELVAKTGLEAGRGQDISAHEIAQRVAKNLNIPLEQASKAIAEHLASRAGELEKSGIYVGSASAGVKGISLTEEQKKALGRESIGSIRIGEPKEEVVPPAGEKKDIAAFWDALSPDNRFKIAQRLGWNKRDAGRIAKSKWADLTPAARNVLSNNLKFTIKEKPKFTPGDRVTWKNVMGETFTGTVRNVLSDGKLEIETDQFKTAAGVPIKQMSLVDPGNPTLRLIEEVAKGEERGEAGTPVASAEKVAGSEEIRGKERVETGTGITLGRISPEHRSTFREYLQTNLINFPEDVAEEIIKVLEELPGHVQNFLMTCEHEGKRGIPIIYFTSDDIGKVYPTLTEQFTKEFIEKTQGCLVNGFYLYIFPGFKYLKTQNAITHEIGHALFKRLDKSTKEQIVNLITSDGEKVLDFIENLTQERLSAFTPDEQESLKLWQEFTRDIIEKTTKTTAESNYNYYLLQSGKMFEKLYEAGEVSKGTRILGRIAKKIGEFSSYNTNYVFISYCHALNRKVGRLRKYILPIDERITDEGFAFLSGERPEILAQALEGEIKLPEEKLIPKEAEGKIKEKGKEGGEEAPEATERIADFVSGKLKKGEAFTSTELFKVADEAYGGTQAEGKYTPKDAYDAMELGVNRYIYNGFKGSRLPDEVNKARVQLEAIKKRILDNIPTQTKRTTEQDEFQQFSTPPNLAYVAAWVANINPEDIVLEPSAGVGGLAVFAKAVGAKTIVNELSRKRAVLLEKLGFDRVFTENAEQLHNILPRDIKPTVILMNPPFSATAGRMEGKRSTKNAILHIEQALKRLEPGGRLVAIVGRGMADNAPAFRDWWAKIKKEYNIRANVGIDGRNYAKYGTSFDVQLIVIDKTGPTPEGGTITGNVTDLKDILPLLEVVKNDRTIRPAPEAGPAEQIAGKPVREGAPEEGRGEAGPGPGPVSASVGGVGAGAGSRVGERAERPEDRTGRPARGEAGAGEAGLPGTGEKADVLEPPREGHGPALEERPDRLPGERAVGKAAGAGEEEVTGGRGAVPGGELAGGPERGRTAEQPAGLKVETAETPRTEEELTDAVYTPYQPQKLKIPGAKPHPGFLAQSAAMAAVEPPVPTYTPNLPEEVIKEGKLSIAQMEAVVYAGQAHQQVLPNGQRRGFFIGDGTGVGKGREISGIILDNMRQGRKKAVWISKNTPLLRDAQRDFADVGGDPKLIFDFGKIKLGMPIKQKEGVLFTTYNTLAQGLEVSGRGGVGAKEGQRARIDQIVNWLGKDFDGVIVFDEAHHMKNSLAQKGKRGLQKPALMALAGVELQNRLPNARIVYVSATGATEVYNLAYAERLGLWGEGTPFANKNDFIAKVSSGGLAAMELVARDMKAMGVYLARNLDYTGVTYGTLEHQLTKDQEEIYDTMARAWQIVLQNVERALDVTDADPRAKGNARAQFWAAQQRFFNQVLTSMQMPSVIKRVREDLARGDAVVMQLVNTNEATQNRQLSKIEEEEELESLDLTPRDILMQYLDKSFPTQQYEEYTDENGNIRFRPVYDSMGRPVHNQEALEMKEELMSRLGAMKVPEGPLEIILRTFGVENVAEVTGRTRRVVWVKDESGHVKPKVETRTSRHAEADALAFMDDKKRILIFSDAGGTGRSYHADLTKKNQRKRIHYLIQPGWRADNAVQGFGRTHRTNQASAPHYILVTTNLKGQKRFISSIARRLDQLGALTKGQRQTGSQGLFSAKDNLESEIAKDALQRFYEDLAENQIEGLSPRDILRKMGLENLIDEHGNLLEKHEALRDITRFLNRILVLETELQNKVFEEFSNRLDQMVEIAIANGTLDFGLENFRADKVKVIDEKTVYTEEKSGAETKYIELEASYKIIPTTFEEAQDLHGLIGFYRNTRSGRVYAVRKAGQKTLESGKVVKYYWLVGQADTRPQTIDEDQLMRGNYEKLDREEARKLWKEALKEVPEYRTEKVHLISGALLPIWDRLPEGNVRVLRVRTDDGRVFLGRLIPTRLIDAVLKRLGAERTKPEYTPAEIVNKILEENYTVYLANEWKITRRRVSGEYRIEIIGTDLWRYTDQLKKEGVFTERISFETRYFIPTGEKAAEVLANVIKYRPIVDIVPPAIKEGGEAVGDRIKQTIEELNKETAPKIEMREKYKGASLVANLIGRIRSKNDAKLSDPEVEAVLNAWGLPRYLLEHVKATARGLTEAVKDIFVYEWRLGDFPQFADDLRKFQGVARDAQVWALNALRGVLGHLENPREFELFRRMVVLRDLKEGLQNGEIVPGGITLKQVKDSIKELEPKLNQNIKLALEAHDKLMRAVWEELQARGKVSPLEPGRKHYFPHRIMDYVRDFDRRFPAIARRFKTPYRYYLQERKGSERLIDTDYTGVTMRHLVKVFIDNATDDFALKIASKYDMWQKLSKEERQKIGNLIPGKLYDIKGERYLAWQYDPGRQIYPDSSLPEKVALDIAEQLEVMEMSREEAAEKIRESIKTKPAIGRYKKTYLLPEEIALRLIRLREPGLNSRIFNAVRDAVRWWKGMVLGPLGAGIPFQTMNFFGDVMNLFREDPRALLYLAQGWKAAAQWQKNVIGPEFRRLIEVAEETRVLEAGLMTRKGGLPAEPILEKLEPQRYLYRRINPFEYYGKLSERRELAPRLAKLIADLKRIDAGEMPQVKIFDVQKLKAAGMTPEEIAGKIAREFTVDYSKLTPEGREVLRDLLFPFLTFYVGNFQNWISYMARNPADTAVKFVIPFVALCLWNWLKYRDIEEKLPLYYRVMPHLITGFKTPDGRPVIIALQTPLDMAVRILGLEIVPDLARQVLNGEKTLDEAAKQLGKHIIGAPFRQMWDLLNPFLKAPIEAAMNRDTFRDKPIVPQRLLGTSEDRNLRLKYVVEQWLAPYAQYMRAIRAQEGAKWPWEIAARGPYSVKRALGIREVDTARELVNRFYDDLEKAENVYKEAKLKTGLSGEKAEHTAQILAAIESQKEKRLVQALPALRAISNDLADLRKELREIQASDKYTDEQKKRASKKLDWISKVAASYVYGQEAPPPPPELGIGEAETQKWINHFNKLAKDAIKNAKKRPGGPV